MDANFDVLPKVNRFQIGDVDICHDHANFHKGLVLRKKAQLDPISNACLFEICEMFGVVDVPLRIQIPISDLDGMIEMKIAHGAIIVCLVKGHGKSGDRKTVICLAAKLCQPLFILDCNSSLCIRIDQSLFLEQHHRLVDTLA